MKTHRALPLAAALVLLSELPLAVHTANRDERLPRNARRCRECRPARVADGDSNRRRCDGRTEVLRYEYFRESRSHDETTLNFVSAYS